MEKLEVLGNTLNMADRYCELLSKINIEDNFGMTVNETSELMEIIGSDRHNANTYFYVIAYAFAVGHQRGQAQNRQEIVNNKLKGGV